jgi:HEAT repeat protein
MTKCNGGGKMIGGTRAGWLVPLLSLLAACSGVAIDEDPPTAGAVVDEALIGVSSYRFGESRTLLSDFEERIRHAGPEECVAIEKQLLWILRSPDATFPGRQFACRMLRRIGSPRAVPVLEELLGDEEMTHSARFALEGMPYPEVGAALRRALGGLTGDRRIGLIDTLGARGDREAVSLLTALLEVEDEATVHAAIVALGRIGGASAVRALREAELEPVHLDERDDALLRGADSLLAEGEEERALSLYREQCGASHPIPRRVAAWRGLLRARPDHALEELTTLLEDPEPELREAAGSFLVELPPGTDWAPLLARLARFEPEVRVLVLGILAGRVELDCPNASASALEALDAGEEAVRIAGLRALGSLGDSRHVVRVAWFAGRSGAEGEAAIDCLERIGGPLVNDAITGCLETLPDSARAALVPVLVARGAEGAEAVLMDYALRGDDRLRRACLDSLGGIVDAGDLPPLLSLLAKLEEEGDRQRLVTAIEAAHGRGGEAESTVALVAARLEGAEGPRRASLLRILGAVPTDRSLALLLEAVSDLDPGVHGAAIEALAAWPDDGPLETLRDLSRQSEDAAVRLVTLQGYLRLVTLSVEGDAAGIGAAFAEAFEAAHGLEEKQAVIDAVVRAGSSWGVAFLHSREEDVEAASAAATAGERLCSILARKVPHAAQGCEVVLSHPPVERYRAGGPAALTDGIWGSTTHGDGCWHGFEGEDLIAVIDFEEPIELSSIRVGYLRNPRSWVFPPAEVEFSISEDGETFESLGILAIEGPVGEEEATLGDAFLRVEGRRARFVRILAKNIGLLPAWHSGTGEKAWLFIDEIQVNPSYGE